MSNFLEFLNDVSEDNIIETIFIIIQELDNQELDILNKKQGFIELKEALKSEEKDLFDKTDFKGLKITNAEGRKSYLKDELFEYYQEIQELEHNIKLQENTIQTNKRFLRLYESLLSKYEDIAMPKDIISKYYLKKVIKKEGDLL